MRDAGLGGRGAALAVARYELVHQRVHALVDDATGGDLVVPGHDLPRPLVDFVAFTPDHVQLDVDLLKEICPEPPMNKTFRAVVVPDRRGQR
jgi:hypothetical protein